MVEKHNSIPSTRSGKVTETGRSIQWGFRGKYVCARRLNDNDTEINSFERARK
jgi:hypothetical protein